MTSTYGTINQFHSKSTNDLLAKNKPCSCCYAPSIGSAEHDRPKLQIAIVKPFEHGVKRLIRGYCVRWRWAGRFEDFVHHL